LHLENLAELTYHLPPREAATVISEAPHSYIKAMVKDKQLLEKARKDIKEKIL